MTGPELSGDLTADQLYAAVTLLMLAEDQQHDQAAELLRSLPVPDQQAVPQMMLVWADITLAEIGVMPSAANNLGTKWRPEGTNSVLDEPALEADEDENRTAVVWAGKLITARANLDFPAYKQLMREALSGNEAHYGLLTFALLITCGGMIRTARAGLPMLAAEAPDRGLN